MKNKFAQVARLLIVLSLLSAIRIGNLKLIEFPEEQRIELYDLDKDIGEARNLASERPADRDRSPASVEAKSRRTR